MIHYYFSFWLQYFSVTFPVDLMLFFPKINVYLKTMNDKVFIFFLEWMGAAPIYRSIGNFGKKLLTKKLMKLSFPKKPVIWGLKKFLEFLIENFSGLKMSSAGKVTEEGVEYM